MLKIEMPQIQYTGKVADDSVPVQRQVSPRTTETKHRIFKLTANICKQRIFRLIDLAHEITGVKVVQKTWHKLLDDRQHASERSHIAAMKEVAANSNTDISSRVSQTTLSDVSKNMEEPSRTENKEEIDDQTRSMDSHEIQCEKEYWSNLGADTGTLFFPDKIMMEPHSLTHFPSQPWCKVRESIKGLNDKHSKFEIEQENVTDTLQCVISPIAHGEQVAHRNTGKGKIKHTGKGKGKHVDVVEKSQPSETASTVVAIVGGDSDESMDMVRLEAEACRLVHSRYAQNTLIAEIISGHSSTTTLTNTTWNRMSKSSRKISLECSP